MILVRSSSFSVLTICNIGIIHYWSSYLYCCFLSIS
nr:MAG TPA: hypothetical protein [Caudoviricetes sp.]DAV59974.1 MAG TPA: hypothetical protein [Caudoviricetes sp.]